MVQGLGYGSANQDKEVIRNNDAVGGNDILRGQAIALLLSAVGISPNTADSHPLGSRAGANSASVIGVATERINKGPGVATGEGEFGEYVKAGFVQVRPTAAAVAAGQSIGPDASGDWDDSATRTYAVLLEASGAANQDLKLAYFHQALGAANITTAFGGA